ncbi:MAG: PAS domain S-box protein [Vicinamibacterales bacterium]
MHTESAHGSQGDAHSLHNLRAIVESMAEGIVLQDATGAIVECNEAAEQILGLTRDQMMGRTSMDPRWRAVREDCTELPGEEHPPMLALRTGMSQRGRMMGIHKPDGTLQWLSVNSTLLVDAEGTRVVSVFADVTSRRAAERAAARLHALSASIVESALDAVVSIDEHGIVQSWNARAVELFGFSRNEAVGRLLSGLIIPERHRAAHDAGLARFRQTGGGRMVGTQIEIDALRKDGSVVPVELSLAAARMDGQVVFNAFIRDLTERRAIEAEVATSRQLIAGISDVQAHFIAGEDPHAVFSRMLDTVLVLTGSEYGLVGEVYRRTDGSPFLRTHAIVDRSWSGELRSDCAPGLGACLPSHDPDSPFGRAIASGVVVIDNAWSPALHGPDSHPAGTPMACLGLPIHANGRLVGMVGIVNRREGYDQRLVQMLEPYLATCGQLLDAIRRERDRAAMGRALAESEARMRVVLDATGVGQWDWNPQTDDAHFDDQWALLAGYTLGEIVQTGSNWIALLHPDDLAAVGAALDAHLRGDTAQYRTEFRMRHKDGRWIWIAALGRVVERDAEGRASRMVGIHIDVTAQKANEEALAQARDAAEAANRAKTEFLANMSHELRTPMNGVLGAAHLLLATPLDAGQHELADMMIRSGEILLSLIDDVLDFAKIEADRLVLERVPFDPRETMAEAATVVAPRADEQGIDVVVDWACEPVAAMVGDQKRLRQVLLNLASNAVKFSSREAVVLRVERPGPDLLRFLVIDRGIGIPVEQQQSIFEKFVQADSSTTRRFGGSGLGLAISRRLVEAMGGTIGVCSTPGHGSTFWFTVPLGVRAPAAAAADGVLLTQALPSPAPLAGVRAFLVADGDALAAALDRELARAGAVTVRCADMAAVGRRQGHASTTRSVAIVDWSPRRGEVRAFAHDLLTSGWTQPLVVLAPAGHRDELRHALAGATIQVVAKPVLRAALVTAVRGALAEGEDAQVLALPRPSESRTGRPYQGLRVLLAEDNDINRLVATRMLARLGCEVSVATDGRAAVAMCAAARYDIILMDCDMPVMDGFQATAAIRGCAWRPHDPGTPPDVAIVALTANALPGDRERCVAAGMTGHLAKPIIPATLRRALDDWAPATPAARPEALAPPA